MATHLPCRVVPVRSGRERRQFVSYPYRLYRDCLTWVPPLRLDMAHTLHPRKNPFFEHGSMQLFLAVDASGMVVGRIAGIVNGMHLKKYQDDVGFFGFFECEERYETAKLLLDTVAEWAREQGLRGLRGPANPTLNDPAGLLVDGFDRAPSALMTYNFPYYEKYLLRWGCERVMTMWAYYLHFKFMKISRLRRGAEIVRRRNPGLRLRTVDMSRFEEEARVVREIYNDAWSDNWGFVSSTEAEFTRLARDVKKVLDPRLLFILEKNEEPVAFALSIPNINEILRGMRNGRLLPSGIFKLLMGTKVLKIKDLRMPLMGVRKDFQGRAFDVLLVLEAIERAQELGYNGGEMSWVLDSNQVLRNFLQSIGSVVDKEYALFEKHL